MNWYVLYALSNKFERLIINLNKRDNIEAFISQYEYYRRSIKGCDIKSMFKDYIFVKSTLNQSEFNLLLQNIKEEKDGLIKQLVRDDVSALRKEEIDMFEKLLDDNHIVRMSQAFLQDGKAVVSCGPLKPFENNIVKIDRHNHIARLNLSFMNIDIIVGIIFTGKK